LPKIRALIVTRWGTWLEAAMLYAKNLNNFKLFVEELSADDAHAVKNTKKHLIIKFWNKILAFLKAKMGGEKY
jgi:hypothetical protein